jgi:hypothetical protein
MPRPDLHQDALQRYQDALARAKLAAEAWHEAGMPLTLTHVNRLVGTHPLLKILTDAELHADKLRSALRAEERGTWRVPVPRPGRSGSLLPELLPAASLRAVKGGKS